MAGDGEIVDGLTEGYLADARKIMDAETAAQFEQSCGGCSRCRWP